MLSNVDERKNQINILSLSLRRSLLSTKFFERIQINSYFYIIIIYYQERNEWLGTHPALQIDM